MRGAGNPIGIGAPFVKQMFIVNGNRMITEEINGEIFTYERRFVPAKLDDNPFIDRNTYIRSLSALEPHILQALLNGDWDVKPPGKMVRREKFRIVPVAPAECWWVRFWDLAGTDEEKAGTSTSWTVGLKMGTDGSGIYYIADVKRERRDPAGVKELVIQTAMDPQDGPETPIFIEQEGGSSGKAVIDDYVKSLPLFKVEGRHPSGPKIVRAVPFANQAGAGNVR